MRVFLWLLALCACAASAAEPLRVVSLAPSMSEIMLELQADDLLVGMLDGGERPPALQDVPSVGRLGQLNMERLLSLKPDLLRQRSVISSSAWVSPRSAPSPIASTN